MRAPGTIAELDALRRAWARPVTPAPVQASGRLTLRELKGPNPGGLRMWTYAPEQLAPTPSLVVVLHGCKQTAEGYDHGTGWSTLAERHGFVLLFPEQQSSGNPNLCFNWFSPQHTARGCGEALSIADMVLQTREEHGIAPARTFITGLSAGGAMACVMLATYPELFAAGAIIAGLPYGAASNVHEAFRSMFQGAQATAEEAGDKVRAASHHAGPWPTISIWHGSADKTVVPGNADAIAQQWLNVHGLSAAEPEIDMIEGHPRQTWRGPENRHALVRSIALEGMDHGVPLHPNALEDAVGNAGPFLLDVGLCSTRAIADEWGLLAPVEKDAIAPPVQTAPEPDLEPEPEPVATPEPVQEPEVPSALDPQSVTQIIEPPAAPIADVAAPPAMLEPAPQPHPKPAPVLQSLPKESFAHRLVSRIKRALRDFGILP